VDEVGDERLHRLRDLAARPAWAGAEADAERLRRQRTSEYTRSPWEWLPRPTGGRSFTLASRKRSAEPIYLQVVPGPGRLYQIVRVDLTQPVARGFRTKKEASRWIELAVARGILPAGVTEVEPGP